MTVRELKEFLDTCDQEIQVIVTKDTEEFFSVMHSIKSVSQVRYASLHDEPKYPKAVEIIIK